MLQRHCHIVIYILLFSYLLLGAAGYLETLTICGFWTNQRITKPADSPTAEFKIYYTQHKHIPSTVKISVPSPTVFAPPELHHIYTYSFTFIQDASCILSDPSFSLHSSRAPPQI